MWFRPGQHNESDRFRVSSIRNRIRRRKSTTNPAKKQNADGSSEDIVEVNPFSELPSSATAKENENAGVHVAPVGAHRSASGRRSSLHAALNHRTAIDANLKSEKEKVLLNDRKFKSNRIAKSSSKSKMADLIDKTQHNVKSAQLSSASARKISAPTTLDAAANNNNSPKPKSVRTNANLNLNALLRYKSFISGNTKKLTHEDFDRLRRKSLGENGKLNARRSSGGAEKKDAQKQSKFGRNGSNVEHSCTEFTDDEMFHSCNDEDDGSSGGCVGVDADSANGRNVRHASPSLTSRVAARFTEGVHKKKAAAKQKCDRRKASCYCYPTTEGCYDSFIHVYVYFHSTPHNFFFQLLKMFPMSNVLFRAKHFDFTSRNAFKRDYNLILPLFRIANRSSIVNINCAPAIRSSSGSKQQR